MQVRMQERLTIQCRQVWLASDEVMVSNFSDRIVSTKERKVKDDDIEYLNKSESSSRRPTKTNSFKTISNQHVYPTLKNYSAGF